MLAVVSGQDISALAGLGGYRALLDVAFFFI